MHEYFLLSKYGTIINVVSSERSMTHAEAFTHLRGSEANSERITETVSIQQLRDYEAETSGP